ncbi:MAG TPA: ribonuclease HII [Advenella sp.]|nr:ribonuclease HII [Advenella sp.]
MTAGIDEAGRGPLAGDVFAAAVILDPGRRINGLADSKALTAAKRESLALRIRDKALAWSIASASVAEIDQLNILGATMLAMKRAFEGLAMAGDQARAELVLIDGNQVPKGLNAPCHAVIKGDALHACISAASILAKTARDAQLLQLHEQYPQYAFDQHKGYGTALHLARLKVHGPCPVHRSTFAPVRALISLQTSDGFLA